MAARALLVSSDLFFISKVKEAAAGCAKELKTVRSLEALEQESAPGEASAGLLIIDLEKLPIPLEALAQAASSLSGRGWKVVSFFSHVHVTTAENARGLGLGEPIPRSKFVRVLPELLAAL